MAKIQFVETTVFDGDVYIEIWSEDKHYSFLAEDVLDAMNAQRKSCEGACENHVGDVVTVHVTSPKGNDWGEFDYCEEAIAEDRRRGFTVEIE